MVPYFGKSYIPNKRPRQRLSTDEKHSPVNVRNISIIYRYQTHLGAHLDEGADIQRDHGRPPVPIGARVVTNTFLAPGAHDHEVEPHKVKSIHLAGGRTR